MCTSIRTFKVPINLMENKSHRFCSICSFISKIINKRKLYYFVSHPQAHVVGFQIKFLLYTYRLDNVLHSQQDLIFFFHFQFKLHFTVKSMFKLLTIFTFTSSVLFETQSLSDISTSIQNALSKILKLPSRLSELTINGKLT